MRRFVSGLLLAAGVLGPAASAVAAPARPAAVPGPASLGIRLVDIPVAEGADMRAWWYIIDHVPPGAVIRRRVLVDNISPSVARVSVYPDAAVIRHGSFVGDAGQAVSELTTWTSTSRHVLRLAPRATAMVRLRIKVPRDASPGERYGVVWAQEASRIRARGGFAVREVNRVGIRIYLSVGPGGPPPTDFAIVRITARRQGGAPVVAAQVRNTGGRAVDLSGRLKLSDGPGGTTAGPFQIMYGTTLAPGQAGLIRTVLPSGLPDGPWRVVIDLRSGLTQRRAHATVSFGAAGSAANVAAVGLYSAVAAIAVAGLAFLVRGRRIRRSRRWEAMSDQSPA